MARTAPTGAPPGRPVLVDTDLVVDFLRGAEPGCSAVSSWLRSRALRLSALTAYELCTGADFLRREAEIAVLLAGRVLAFDVPVALLAGTVASDLRARGQGIGHADAMIAATGLRYGLPLATRNRRHFSRIPGLELLDPAG